MLLVASAFLVSGCSSSGGAVDASGSTFPPPPDIDPNSGLGAIVGVVVNEAIRPIAFANITIAGTETRTMADAAGGFAFADLTPGTYFLTASAPGYYDAQTSTDVVAGEAATVRISLLADLRARPYHETLHFNGFFEAGAGFATFAISTVFQELNQTICTCQWNVLVPADTWGFTYEATWVSNLPCTGTEDDLYYQVYENGASTIHIASGFLPNPIHVVLNRTEMWPDFFDFNFSLNEGFTCLRYQQPFDLYVTVWHNGEPPEGWSFIAGDK